MRQKGFAFNNGSKTLLSGWFSALCLVNFMDGKCILMVCMQKAEQNVIDFSNAIFLTKHFFYYYCVVTISIFISIIYIVIIDYIFFLLLYISRLKIRFLKIFRSDRQPHTNCPSFLCVIVKCCLQYMANGRTQRDNFTLQIL